MFESRSAPDLNVRNKLGAIPKGRKSSLEIALPPPSKVPTAYTPLATVGPSIISRMMEAVRLQARAICEINLHAFGPVERAASRRVQAGWEVVRVCVCFASDDTAREAAAMEAFVWPELRARCAARRLHLLVVEPRQGWPHVPPGACVLQLQAGALTNEGAPFVVCVQGGKDGWVPPQDQLTGLGERWVHGLSQGDMEVFEAACRMQSRAVQVLARRVEPIGAPQALSPYGSPARAPAASALSPSLVYGGAMGAPSHRRRASSGVPWRNVDPRQLLLDEQRKALRHLVWHEMVRERLPASQFGMYAEDELSGTVPSPFSARVLESLWEQIVTRYPAEPPTEPLLAAPSDSDVASKPGGAKRAMSNDEAATTVQKYIRGANARSSRRLRFFRARPLAVAEVLRRALWFWEREDSAFTNSMTGGTTELIGRQVELLRLMQLVAAQVGLGAARKPGVPSEATQRPTNGMLRAPLLLLAPHGMGKTALLVRLVERLEREHPQLSVASHYASVGVGGAELARVALTRLTVYLMALLARDAGDDKRRQRAVKRLVVSTLPLNYASLCSLCRSLLEKLTSPLLVLWDGVERLQPPLEGTPALDWVPAQLPPNVSIVFCAAGDPLKPTEPEAAKADKEAREAKQRALGGGAGFTEREERSALAEAALLEATANAHAAPVLEELRTRHHRPQVLEFAPLSTDSARLVLRADVLRLTGLDAPANIMQAAITANRSSSCPMWLRCIALTCGRAALADRIQMQLRLIPGAVSGSVASTMLTPAGGATGGGDGLGRAAAGTIGARGGNAAMPVPPALATLAARLRDGSTLRADETELCRLAAVALQSAYNTSKRQLQSAVKAHSFFTGARAPAGRNLKRHMTVPAPASSLLPSPAGAPQAADEINDSTAAAKRMELPGVMRARADAAAEEAAILDDDDGALARALGALRCEVYGLRMALRLLTLLSVSEHGFGLSEAHAHTILAPEVPPRSRGAVWTLACQHVALFCGCAVSGVWSFPNACVAAGMRSALLQNGPGHEEHETLARHYLSCIDPAYDGTFQGGEAAGADEPVCLLGAAYHLWRGGPDQVPTLIGLLRNPAYSSRRDLPRRRSYLQSCGQ